MLSLTKLHKTNMVRPKQSPTMARVTIVLASMLCLCTTLHSKEYRFFSLDIPNAKDTSAVAVNNDNVIVGSVRRQNHEGDGFIWDGGEFLFPEPEGIDVHSFDGINDFGTIVGTGFSTDGNQRFEFTLRGDEATIFDHPDVDRILPMGINNQGEMVGLSSGIPIHLDEAGTLVELLHSEYSNLIARDVNNRGLIAGSVTDRDGHVSGFILEDDGISLFSHSDGRTAFLGINDVGDAVGTYRSRGFVFDGEEFHEVMFPGSEFTFVQDINNSGVIVGNYRMPGNLVRTTGFVGFPIPEPSSHVLMLSGLLALSVARMKRQNFDSVAT